MGQRQFVILYKRYSRKRVCYKKALSNGNPKEIEKTKRDLDAYDFFHWFNDHLREYKGRNAGTPGGEEYGQFRNHGDDDFNQSDEDSTESLTMIQTNHYGDFNPTYLQEEENFDEKPATQYHHNILTNPNFQNENQISPCEQQAPTENSNQHGTVATNFHPTPILVSEKLDSSTHTNHTPQQTLSSRQQQQQSLLEPPQPQQTGRKRPYREE